MVDIRTNSVAAGCEKVSAFEDPGAIPEPAVVMQHAASSVAVTHTEELQPRVSASVLLLWPERHVMLSSLQAMTDHSTTIADNSTVTFTFKAAKKATVLLTEGVSIAAACVTVVMNSTSTLMAPAVPDMPPTVRGCAADSPRLCTAPSPDAVIVTSTEVSNRRGEFNLRPSAARVTSTLSSLTLFCVATAVLTPVTVTVPEKV